MKQFYVYILTNKKYGTLYIGVTNNLERRIYEHRNKLVAGFTKKYNLDKLVYFEETNSIVIAINREKQLKKWNRQWKLELINKENPSWKDLAELLKGKLLYPEIPNQVGNDEGDHSLRHPLA